MPKIAIIGAGSAVFATGLIRDILSTPGLDEGEFALVDVDVERLELAHQMAERMIGLSKRDWSVHSSTDRRQVLAGSDFVINTIEVAGLENVRHDYEIPLKYGLDQCIGDTIGPGGLFKALRTLPDWIEILRDVEIFAPECLVMNYTNPMSITVLAGIRCSHLPIVGLCHSVQNTTMQLAVYLGLTYPELEWRCAGINHLAWFLELSRDGQDLYPLLCEKANIKEIYEQDPVRFELMKELGYFVTESSGHASEYLPYFRKRPDLIQRYMRSGYRGESGFYANNWPTWRAEGDEDIRQVLAGESPLYLNRGTEYASIIIEAIVTGVPQVIYGNVPNTGLIENLPYGGIVELACLVDRRGVQPTYVGKLPVQLAAINAQHIAFHEMVVNAVVDQDRETAVRALMIDPLCSAVCSLAEIRAMFDEMCAAEKEYLPAFVTG
jgi:alpha-galactosidase